LNRSLSDVATHTPNSVRTRRQRWSKRKSRP
jgi:hypothetical protein